MLAALTKNEAILNSIDVFVMRGVPLYEDEASANHTALSDTLAKVINTYTDFLPLKRLDLRTEESLI